MKIKNIKQGVNLSISRLRNSVVTLNMKIGTLVQYLTPQGRHVLQAKTS